MAEKVIIEYEIKENGVLQKTRVLNKEIAGTEQAGEKAAKGLTTFSKVLGGISFAYVAKQAAQSAADFESS